jgi:hypothetical protein
MSHTHKAWEVEITDQFTAWWSTLTDDQRVALVDRIEKLVVEGPDLGRPLVDRIHSSRHHGMKELRATKDGALRVLFAFDPRRMAILLFGGDKSGEWNAWYRWAVPLADDLYDEYLQEPRDEGLI